MDMPNISWGSVVKGAAIAAGAVAVATWLIPPAAAVVTGAGVGTFISSAIGTAVSWISAHAGLSYSIAAAIGGGIGAVSSYKENLAEQQAEAQRAAFENESFAMREDMRRMQALMAARMQATGYQVAAAGQGRG